MARKPETRLVGKILEALRERGGYWIKVHGSPFQRRGIPDIIGCYCGRFYAFEVKVDPEAYDATELQQKNITDITKERGVACIVCSTEEALKILNKEA